MTGSFQRTNATGRSTGRYKPQKHTKIEGQFAPRLIEMIASPAHRKLSLSARLVLDRLEIEHASHGGKMNGALIATHADFVAFGIHRNAVAPAIREAAALGFIEVRKGAAGNGEFRQPSRFRLCYLHTNDAPATNEWRKIPDTEIARALARVARDRKEEPDVRKRRMRMAS